MFRFGLIILTLIGLVGVGSTHYALAGDLPPGGSMAGPYTTQSNTAAAGADDRNALAAVPAFAKWKAAYAEAAEANWHRHLHMWHEAVSPGGFIWRHHHDNPMAPDYWGSNYLSSIGFSSTSYDITSNRQSELL
jgi:hypothetical protein